MRNDIEVKMSMRKTTGLFESADMDLTTDKSFSLSLPTSGIFFL